MVMKAAWDSLIQRAEALRRQSPETEALLTFYTHLLGAQQQAYEFFRGQRGWQPSGSLAGDLAEIGAALGPLLEVVAAHGPERLAAEARGLRQASVGEVDGVLLRYWRSPTDTQFFAKAFLQPYVSRLAELGRSPLDRELASGDNRCPFCAGKPQLAVLKIQEPGAESGGRYLMCATCFSTWPFRRVVCANCGEERPAQLGYFHAPAFDHLRIDACDTCRHYIKAIDLTKFGLAVPLVDEVAAAALDLWAREHGYTKIELNLIGL